MILAAREAGDLRSKGGDPGSKVDEHDLGDFGIGRDLAAAAVRLDELRWRIDTLIELEAKPR